MPPRLGRVSLVAAELSGVNALPGKFPMGGTCPEIRDTKLLDTALTPFPNALPAVWANAPPTLLATDFPNFFPNDFNFDRKPIN